MLVKIVQRWVLLVTCLFASGAVLSQVPGMDGVKVKAAAEAVDTAPVPRSVSAWLLRMHEASRRRAYVGTLVVTSGASMASSRIWHVCDGASQVERVETLTGVPRSTFRLNDQVVTFWPASRIAVAERRESLGLFPNLLSAPDSAIASFYDAKALGTDRVAGFDSDVIQVQPKDKMRFGYRIWSERKTGLMVKMQTLDVDGRVLEQVAFSELQLDAPVSMDRLTRMMGNTEGYALRRPEIVQTTALAQGWILKDVVAGFRPMGCNRRRSAAAESGSTSDEMMQWIFSDGLASVSVFVESFDSRRHGAPGGLSVGATHTVTRRLTERGAGATGDWWLTVVGETPVSTLATFAQGLERRRAVPK